VARLRAVWARSSQVTPATASLGQPASDSSRRGGREVLFVTNAVTHYRKPLYQRLAVALPARFVLFSDGQEWYWNKPVEPVQDLPATVLPGHWVGPVRVVRGLRREVTSPRHDVVIKCINGRYVLPATYVLARLSRKRFVLWTSMWRHPEGRFHRVSRPVTAWLYRHADAVLTYGRHVTAHVVQGGADPRRVLVAPQAVDMTLFRPQDEPRDTRMILFVGRLEISKGPQVLIAALQMLTRCGVDFTACIVGTGPLDQALRDEAVKSDLPVKFLGAVDNAELPGIYARAAVTVVPSVATPEFAEPWSLVVNEAMACGSAVVASTEVGAMQDGLVEHGVTGLVVPAGRADALAEAIERLVTDPAAARQLAEAGSRRVAAYTYDAAVEAFQRAVSIARLSPRARRRQCRTR